MDSAAIAAAINSRRITIHKDNAEEQSSAKADRTAARNKLRLVVMLVAATDCGDWPNSWAQKVEAVTAGRSREIIT